MRSTQRHRHHLPRYGTQAGLPSGGIANSLRSGSLQFRLTSFPPTSFPLRLTSFPLGFSIPTVRKSLEIVADTELGFRGEPSALQKIRRIFAFDQGSVLAVID